MKRRWTHIRPRNLLILVGCSISILLSLILFLYLRKPSYTCQGGFDVAFIGGEVIDGLGEKAFKADIGIRNRHVACVGSIDSSLALKVIDVTGLTTSPGFIDVHTHIERNVPTDEPFRAASFVRQGVTTVLTGNCGRSFLDLGKSLKRLQDNRSEINVASLVGHNTIRLQVMKQTVGSPSPEQLNQMKALVDKAMRDGAFGLSTGLVYIPGTFAKTEELADLARSVARTDGLYVSHIRDEGVKGEEAIREALSIGERSGVHVHISHFKVQGPNQWGSALSRLSLLESAQKRGVVVSLDQYPYTASSTGLAVLLPSWLSDGDLGSARRQLALSSTRSRVRDEMLAQLRANGWKDYSFARVAYYKFDQTLVGFTIAEIARKRAQANHPTFIRSEVDSGAKAEADSELQAELQADTIIELFSHGGAQMVFFDMNEGDVETIMKSPQVMFGSDSSVREESPAALPHPRGLGTFPRILGVYAREKRLFSIEEAVRRMTSLPASTFGLKDRGQIKDGYWADLVVFNRNRILDTATYEMPLSLPVGIDYVIVNGSIVLDHGVLTKAVPGMVIRHASTVN